MLLAQIAWICSPQAGGDTAAPISYQLLIWVSRRKILTVGKLGRSVFPAGCYVYTGSARRNLLRRIMRHLIRRKKLRWHIDFLLSGRDVSVLQVRTAAVPECALNQQPHGKILVPGFGASDCRSGCGSHLKFLRPWHLAGGRRSRFCLS
ncbi:MAG TPA: GIY-YIG nuclease family protein, partial [Bacteroidetes bacterium]|nr:GIY-YIG nuclease family protein [Bacteroidota bacterium]